MTLASPQSQEEYDNLISIWKFYKNSEFSEWKDNTAIAGYLAYKTKIWSESGEKLPYNITWAVGEPNNADGNENCMFLNFEGEVASNDGLCADSDNLFICEQNSNRISYSSEEEELDRFLTKFSDAALDGKNVDIYVNKEYLKAPFIEAQILCKFLGLEFYAEEIEKKKKSDLTQIDKFVCFGAKEKEEIVENSDANQKN